MKILRPGRRSILIGAMISLVGGAVAVSMVIMLRMTYSPLFKGEEAIFIASALGGAFPAGVVVSRAFGWHGKKGWLIATLGAVGATVIGAFLGGLMMFQTLDEAIICVLMVGAIIGSTPLIALMWLAMMVLVHLIARRSILFAEIPADLDLVPGPDNL